MRIAAERRGEKVRAEIANQLSAWIQSMLLYLIIQNFSADLISRLTANTRLQKYQLDNESVK